MLTAVTVATTDCETSKPFKDMLGCFVPSREVVLFSEVQHNIFNATYRDAELSCVERFLIT